MKKTTSIILLFIITQLLFADGRGQYYGYHGNIDVFERSFNFYYKSISDTIFYNNEKGKEKYELATTNVAFYDIAANKIIKLFPDSFNQKIEAFYFETGYNDSLHKIDYELACIYHGNDMICNNYKIEKRNISEYIYLVTYSKESKRYTLWCCHKTGGELSAVTEFNNFNNLKIDSYNHQIMLVVKVDNNIKIRTFKIK